MKLVSLVFSLLLVSTVSQAAVQSESAASALPQPPDDRAALGQVFSEARSNLAELESLMRAGNYSVALNKSKQFLDEVRIKAGIHPVATYREKIQLPAGTIEGSFKQIGMSVKDLSIDAQDSVALAVTNHRASYFLDILNLMKRTNLVYIRAMHKVLRKEGKLMPRDRDKIKGDILAVHAIPLYLKDPKVGVYFLAFDYELANSDQNYLFNRELMSYLLEEGKDLEIKNANAVEELLKSSIAATRDAYIRASSNQPAAVNTTSTSSGGGGAFSHPNFKTCFVIYNRSYTSAIAADTCLTRYKTFDFSNGAFKACHDLYSRSYTSAIAADTCLSKSKN